MLPHHNLVLVEIGHVGSTQLFGVLFEDHPAQVRVKETLADRVGVLLGVRMSMMGSMIS